MPNLSQDKRLKMLTFLEQMKNEYINDLDKLNSINEIEKEIISLKYGLNWEVHTENVEMKMDTHIPIFNEVKSKEILEVENGKFNFLLEGDNLHSLKLLEKTHLENIDIVYIDPPYNTGSKDFTYDDKFIDKNDSYKHSKWLSFMSVRLSIIQRLLADTGVIFISIGEQELANLKLLCDDIFGETNFITIFSRQMKSGGAKGKYYTPNIDYVITYAKNIQKLPNFKALLTDKQIATFYNKEQKDGERAGELYGEERLFKASLDKRPNQRYYIQCPDGSFAIPPGENFPSNIVEGEIILPQGNDKVWKWTYPTYQRELAKDNIVFKQTKTSGLVDENGKQSKWNIYNKLWLSEQANKGVVPSNFITEFENRQSSKELKDLKLDFTYAKPVNLIKYLIQITNQKKDCTVLDCFAGSGTTGHAVLKLNESDGGNRNFILCTNNENNICEEVTYPRLKKVIKGYEDIKNNLIQGIPANLKLYKSDFVEKNDIDVISKLQSNIKELIQLQYAVDLENNEHILILTDEDADYIELNWNEYNEQCKAIYLSRDVLLTAKQNKLFNNKEVYIIPDYYYEYELREVGELW